LFTYFVSSHLFSAVRIFKRSNYKLKYDDN